MEEVKNEFREPETDALKKRAARKKKSACVDVDVSGSPPPISNMVATTAVVDVSKKKSRKKKQTNRQMLEDMFDFHAAVAAASETTDDELYVRGGGRGGGGGRGSGKGRGSGRGGGRGNGRAAAAAVSFVATPACHLSKKERAEIERKFSKPKNESQKKYMSLLNDAAKKVVIATGPAGTGKTLLAAEFAIRNFILGEFEKIIFTRPSVSVDEDLGYLPGTLEEKMAPWMRPLYDILYEHFTARETAAMVEEKVIEICPLGFMRGRTFKDCCIICDEMQNSTPAQMKMLLTRIGAGSRLIITGDLDQCDRGVFLERGGRAAPFRNSPLTPQTSGCELGNSSAKSLKNTPQTIGYVSQKNAAIDTFCNGLEDFLQRLGDKKSNSICSVEFKKEDIEREEVVKEILDIYDAL